MSDEPVIKPAFLPKDREGAIRMIAEVLYGRLEVREHQFVTYIETREYLAADEIGNELTFLRNLLNVLECS